MSLLTSGDTFLLSMLPIHCWKNSSFGSYLFTLISSLAYLSHRPGSVLLAWLLALELTILPIPSKLICINVCGYQSPGRIDNNSIIHFFSLFPIFSTDSFIILTSGFFSKLRNFALCLIIQENHACKRQI